MKICERTPHARYKLNRCALHYKEESSRGDGLTMRDRRAHAHADGGAPRFIIKTIEETKAGKEEVSRGHFLRRYLHK